MKNIQWKIVLPLALAAGLSCGVASWPRCWHLAAALMMAAVAWQAWWSSQRREIVAEIAGLKWTRHTFCQGWLVTGVIGSGKTLSGLNHILHQLFRNQRRCGGLCIDDKGVLYETLVEMAAHYGRSDDLILLQVRPQNAPAIWTPRHRFNLVGDLSIPPATLARCLVDTGVSQGNRQEQSFFRRSAQIEIGQGLEALRAIGYDRTVENLHNLLTNVSDLQTAIVGLKQKPGTQELARHFRDFLDQPPEQRAGIIGTIANYLHYYTAPDVAEVFCRDSTFSLADVEKGKIICLAIPQRLQTERRYLGTLLKQLFYLHLLRRYDLRRAEREQQNLLVLLADEAQHFVTVSEDGLSDHSMVDVIREAGGVLIAATQSTTSLIPPLGTDVAKVLALNLRNRLIFTAADEDDARVSAEFIGRKTVRKKSWTYNNGKRSRTEADSEDYRVKPHALRKLKSHEAVVVHADGRFRRTILPPLEPDGTVSPWFKRPWFTG